MVDNNLKILEKENINIIKKITIADVSDKAIEDAIDNFGLIIRELDQFNYDYTKAVNYGRKVFRGVDDVYVIDAHRDEVDQLSFEYPWVAAMISYDSKNRRWLYFSNPHIDNKVGETM